MENKLKHLEFIQNIIARFNSNCFLIKGWAVTLVAALFALAAKDANERYMFVTYISTIIFWLLDGYYLSKERQYRCLYRKIAAESDTDFTMDTSNFAKGHNTWFFSLFAQAIIVFYSFLITMPLLLILIFKN
ncbi:hypothetical protein IC229_28850 [Spirosoma sp. BT702]|uniref:DUF3278 domain-containing protein n=1 Tax=Spirosoma profusum TaxID=2771354 RepID=A0A926Y156_9BACT|nr:hypothetical protein [Spirosoma profusum]MBD2704679.1 hypothetical protein [Spirosoma profusum]